MLSDLLMQLQKTLRRKVAALHRLGDFGLQRCLLRGQNSVAEFTAGA
jgi:hypothetical protein